jgi:hypothetical protein
VNASPRKRGKVSIRKAVARRAAEILEREAKIMHDSCKGATGSWVCGDCREEKCQAHKEHDEMLRVAKLLKEAA